MGDTFKKVRDGEKLRIPARSYNSMIDAAQDYINRKNNLSSGLSSTLPANMVYIKNTSGQSVDRLNILGISGSLIEPASNNFKESIIFIGVSPSASNHSCGRFLITAEPIATDSIGRAYVTGCAAAQIDVSDEGHIFADITENDVTKLKSAITGPIVILFKESGIGIKWAIVSLRSTGSGTEIRRAKLTADAGSENTIKANLYNSAGAEQTEGSEAGVTIYCDTVGSDALDQCIPRLKNGQEIKVFSLPYGQEGIRWYCTSIFQAIDTTMFDIVDGRLRDKLNSCGS